MPMALLLSIHSPSSILFAALVIYLKFFDSASLFAGGCEAIAFSYAGIVDSAMGDGPSPDGSIISGFESVRSRVPAHLRMSSSGRSAVVAGGSDEFTPCWGEAVHGPAAGPLSLLDNHSLRRVVLVSWGSRPGVGGGSAKLHASTIFDSLLAALGGSDIQLTIKVRWDACVSFLGAAVSARNDGSDVIFFAAGHIADAFHAVSAANVMAEGTVLRALTCLCFVMMDGSKNSTCIWLHKCSNSADGRLSKLLYIQTKVDHRRSSRPSSLSLRFNDGSHVHDCLSPVKRTKYLWLNAQRPQVPSPRRQPGGSPAGQLACTEEALGCHRRGCLDDLFAVHTAGPRRVHPLLQCSIYLQFSLRLVLLCSIYCSESTRQSFRSAFLSHHDSSSVAKKLHSCILGLNIPNSVLYSA